MQHPKSSHINQGPLRAHLMSIDDFMKEQEQFDAVGSADLKARAKAALANSNIQRFRKSPIDTEAAAAEARAVAEIGETNWTGRLIGELILFRSRQYKTEHLFRVPQCASNQRRQRPFLQRDIAPNAGCC